MRQGETYLNAPAAPEDVPQVLRNAADKMREQAVHLAASWSDGKAGKVWTKIARILDRAADQVSRVVA